MDLRLVALSLHLGVLVGCASVIGGTTADLNNRHIIPAVMASGDVGVGCAAGEALGSLVSAFGPYNAKAARAAILPQLSAAMCLEDDAREAELSALRAERARDIPEARDAAERARRFHEAAALRYLDAFRRLEAEYGLPETPEECPKLKQDSDRLTWLMGLSSGVLAVVHDAKAGNTAGVPLSIPAAVVRGSACLPDEDWWGVPSAMRASVFALQPDHPDAGDVWGTFDAAVKRGEAAGVRLASSFYAQTASTVGAEERVAEALRRDAASRAETAADPTWAMLDRYAQTLILHESDRRWTQATGSRTPGDAYGRLPEPERPVELPDDAGLLDGLFE